MTRTTVNLAPLTWHRCDRCGEPVHPSDVLTTREPAPGVAPGLWPTRREHPGALAGCLAAAKDYHRGELRAALARIFAGVADAGGVTPARIRRAVTEGRCNHRGGACIQRHRAELDPEQLQALDDSLANSELWRRHLAGDR